MASRRLRLLASCLGLTLLAPLVSPGSATGEPAPDPAVGLAAGYLVQQQGTDGGFDAEVGSGRETPDVVFALAATWQKDVAWSSFVARTNLQYLNARGRTPFQAVADLVDPTSVADPLEQAALSARVLALVAVPYGLDARSFQPAEASGPPVDLVAQIELARRSDGSFDFGDQFDAVLYAAIGLGELRSRVDAGLVGQITGAQRADGAWSATGSPDAAADVRTTSLALLALRVAGQRPSDPAVVRGVGFLARTQQADGAWQTGGLDDVEATSLASMALSAHHVDVTVATWRSSFVGGSPSAGYVTPYAWLRSRQEAASGRFRSPQDYVRITNRPTSLAIQALGRQWYLNREIQGFATKMSRTLGTPDASPGAASAEYVADLVGPNPSVASGRLRAAQQLLASQTGREAAAADLFRQAFGRTIDASGRSYWGRQLATIPRPEMLSRLTGSDEFYRKAGGTTPTFVDAAYAAVLGRAPEPAGKAYWIGRLDKGVPVWQIARTLVASTEYRRSQVNHAYEELLGREPDVAGRDYWTNKLATTRIEVLLAGIASSRELYDGL